MTEIVSIKKRDLPEWLIDDKGRKRGFGGRWNMQRVAEFLVSNPTWQTVDDLARIVYGCTNKTQRENVRKHIPSQRKHMLNDLQTPIVTQYGQRGRIMRVKIYNTTDESDKALLRMELDRARDRKEVSETRYESLLNIFLLDKPELIGGEGYGQTEGPMI